MKRNPKPLLAVLCAAAFSFWLAFSCSPDWGTLAGQAALASAMLAMPEGSVALLEHRFADKLSPAPSTDEKEVAPYVTPWTEPEEGKREKPADTEKVPPAPGATEPLQSHNAGEPRETANIPKQYRGTLLQENMAGRGGNYLSYGKGWLRNSTETPDSEVLKIMEQGLNIRLEDTREPQVLIVHTHATESYEPLDSAVFDTRNTWRDTDNTVNMVAVGNALENKLKEAGIGVVHDKTQHDYPSYNGAYDRSAATIRKYLEQYPTIKIVLDVHRDAILRADDVTVKPVVEIGGKKAAQLMIITGCEDGTMNVPNWPENLRFAASLQDAIERKYPQLTRPVFFCYRKYNMDLTTGSLLLEVGSNANTLEESVYTAEMVGDALAGLLKGAPTLPPPEEELPSAAAAQETGAAETPEAAPENTKTEDLSNEEIS